MKSHRAIVNDEKFGWDDYQERVVALGTDEEETEEIKSRKKRNVVVNYKSKLYCPHTYLILNFLDTLNPGEKIKFRKHFQRKVQSGEPDIIILQDIKDLVLFLLTTPVTQQFINFFHLNIVDLFLRLLIMYFKLFIDVWNCEIIDKRTATMKKINNPLAGGSRIRRADELKILRCLLAREYCQLVVGCDETIKYHHMAASTGINLATVQSQGEKDLRIFEVLLCIAHKIVWIALQRKHYHLIEVEIHRLFRTDSYNSADRKTGGGIYKDIHDEDLKILHGCKMFFKRKLLKNSPITQQLINNFNDYRVVSLGLTEFESQDPRIIYLKNSMLAKEELLQDLGINVGILGHPRSNYDVILQPIEVGRHASDNERKDSSLYEKTKKKNSVLEEKNKSMPEYKFTQELPEKFPMQEMKKKIDKSDEIREESRKKWILKKFN